MSRMLTAEPVSDRSRAAASRGREAQQIESDRAESECRRPGWIVGEGNERRAKRTGPQRRREDEGGDDGRRGECE
jgi:hypothetical protein